VNEKPIVDPQLEAKLKQPETILAIDDDALVLDLYEKFMARWDCFFIKSQRVEDGLAICKTVGLSLVLLDLRFPGHPLNGVDFLKEAHKLPRKPRIVVLTGYPGSKECEEAMAIGNYYVARKPYTRDELDGILRVNGIILRPRA